MLVIKSPAFGQAGERPPETATTPIVHVVDDEISIQTLFRTLGRSAGFEVAAYGTAAEFLDRFDERRTGCLVLDLNLPDRTGLEVLQDLSERGCRMPVVFMSGMARVSEAVRALKLGSIDFVEKPFDLPVMLDTLQRAITADRQRRTELATNSDLHRRFDRLTAREREVLELVVNGAANKEVAIRLGLSPKTVEVHRSNVMRKTEANSLAELVRMHLALHS